MFSLFSSAKAKNTRVLIFDIAPSSIGASVVEFSLSEKPQVLACIRSPIPFQEQFSFPAFQKLTLSTLLDVSLQVQTTMLPALSHGRRGSIDEMYCFFSPPWYLTKTMFLRQTSQKPFEVTKSLIDEMVEKELQSKQGIDTTAATETIAHDAVPIERCVIGMLLNGYRTKTPYGKKVVDLELTYFMSLFSKDMRERVLHMFQKVFHTDNVTFHSSALAAFTVTRDLFDDGDQFLLCEIGSEVTELFLVREGILYQSVSLPLGKNFVLRAVLSKSGGNREEIEERITRIASGTLTPEALTVPFKEALSYAEALFMAQLEKALALFSDNLTLPSCVYLLTDSPLSNWFAAIFEREAREKFVLAGYPFATTILSLEHVKSLIIPPSKGTLDVPFAIEALFLHKTR